MSYPTPSAICAEELRGLDKSLAIEIARRFNDHDELIRKLSAATKALTDAGFTQWSNNQWTPPASNKVEVPEHIQSALQSQRFTINMMASHVLNLSAKSMPYSADDDALRTAQADACSAALAVIEGKPL